MEGGKRNNVGRINSNQVEMAKQGKPKALGKKEKKTQPPPTASQTVPGSKTNKVGAAPQVSPRGRAAVDKSADKSADDT